MRESESRYFDMAALTANRENSNHHGVVVNENAPSDPPRDGGGAQTVSLWWEVLFSKGEIRRDHEMLKGKEDRLFVVFLIATCISFGLFQIIEPYKGVEICSLTLLVVYLTTHYILLRRSADESLFFASDVIMHGKSLLILSILLIVALVVSMSYPGITYANPHWASGGLALLWRVGISVLSIQTFCRIDSFFNNFCHKIELISNLWDDDSTERNKIMNEVADDELRYEKLNALSYSGFLLCVGTLSCYYSILYFYETEICGDFSLVMYCTFSFITGSTYFLVRMSELNNAVKSLNSSIRKNVRIQVKILHWEPSGDVFVGYAFGLLFLMFTKFINLETGNC